MMRAQWTAARKRAWCAELEGVLALCFLRWPRAKDVRLLFTVRRASNLIAACDRPTFTIGLFPRALTLGRFARQATLVHECCHLLTRGRHGSAWKAAMRRAARAVRKAGHVRLAAVILRDVALYSHRAVSDNEVLKQLRHVVSVGERTDFRWVLCVVADWAGWPPGAFVQRHAWLHEEWRELASASPSSAKRD